MDEEKKADRIQAACRAALRIKRLEEQVRTESKQRQVRVIKNIAKDYGVSYEVVYNIIKDNTKNVGIV